MQFGRRTEASARARLLRPDSDEACEQGRSTGCGVGGAKGGDQGERGPPHTRRTQSRSSVSQGLDPCTGRCVQRCSPSIPEVGAVCPNRARTDLCGGRPVMGVPTAKRPPGGGCGEFVHCVLANAASRSTESSPSNRRNRLPRFGSLFLGSDLTRREIGLGAWMLLARRCRPHAPARLAALAPARGCLNTPSF